MPRKRTRRRATPSVPGLRWRKDMAYYERAHAKIEGGRVSKSLGTREGGLAATYAAALNTLADRGDWSAIARWSRGELHITDIAKAVREGEYMALRRLSAEGPRLGDAIERFLAQTRSTSAQGTVIVYTTALTALRRHLGDDFPMAELDTAAAKEFLYGPKETLGNQPWAPQTQLSARMAAGALWKMVIAEEAESAEKVDALPHVTRNPWRAVKVGAPRKGRYAFLLPEQWQKLITHEEVAGTPTATLLAVACLAGLRLGEIIHLRRTDVALEKNIIRVRDREGEHAWKTKTEHSRREVPIVPGLRALLEEHIESYAGRRYLFRAHDRDVPLSQGGARGWVKRAMEAAGLRYGRKKEGLTPHSLRHTFGSWLASEGVPFHVIAELMGNTATVVIQFYAHLAPNDKARAMKVIAEKGLFSHQGSENPNNGA